MITFHKLSYRNFLSTGQVPIEIDLDTAKNTLFIGSNGAGKSTFLDALCFALFGKPFRRVNKGNVVNSINEKDCRVELEFTTNNKRYKIVRSIKPNLFEIHCNGNLINQDASVKDYQTYLEKTILRMNFKSFTQIVILGAATFTPFMSLSPADRRSVIEDLLDIQIFSVMNAVAKQRANSNKEETEKNGLVIKSTQSNREFIEKTLTSLRAKSEEKLAEFIDKCNDLGDTKRLLTTSIENIEDAIDEKLKRVTTENVLRKKHTTLVGLKSKVENNRDRLLKETNFFQHNTTCPTCTQDIDESFAEQKITLNQKKLVELQDGIAELDAKVDACLHDLTVVEKYVEEISELRIDLSKNKANLKNTEQLILYYQQQIEQIEKSDTSTADAERELKEVEGKLEELGKQRKKLLDEKVFIDTAIMLLKDGGIKTKIIKQYIPIINKHINKYLAKMGFFVNFELDENFEETIKSRHRDVFSYNNFSEGEKLRIDLAILLTWRDIAKMKNSVNTNLLIFDEVLDRSMDLSGIEEFLKIMWDMDSGTNIFVISHKDAMVDRFERIFKFEKVKNFTTLKKDN